MIAYMAISVLPFPTGESSNVMYHNLDNLCGSQSVKVFVSGVRHTMGPIFRLSDMDKKSLHLAVHHPAKPFSKEDVDSFFIPIDLLDASTVNAPQVVEACPILRDSS